MAEKLRKLSGRTFLLGVGAQKAGTTWLHDYFQKHPEVCISPVKEMHFFGNRGVMDGWPVTAFRKKLRQRQENDRLKGREVRNYSALKERIRMTGEMWQYRRFFRKRILQEQVFGEITPAYSSLPVEELQLIKKTFETTKVIFLMRNPADRFWSQMRFSEDYETLDEMEANIDRVFGIPRYQERMNYARTIANLRAVFDEEDLHFQFYENLFTPQAIGEICAFLDIECRPANFSKTLNVSVKMPLGQDTRDKIAGLLADQYRTVATEIARPLPKSWQNDMERLS